MEASKIEVGSKWRRRSTTERPAIIGDMDTNGVRVDDQRNGIYSWMSKKKLLKHWEPVNAAE